MKRYWVSWWSGYYEKDGCTKPPFQIWVSGERDRINDNGVMKNDLSICAVIDAENENQIWDAVGKYFPDYEKRFIDEAKADFSPGNRFPNFNNQTSLIEEQK